MTARHGHGVTQSRRGNSKNGICHKHERRSLEDIQKVTDGSIAKLDVISKSKEKDLLDVK